MLTVWQVPVVNAVLVREAIGKAGTTPEKKYISHQVCLHSTTPSQ